jgi:hypothetical protein
VTAGLIAIGPVRSVVLGGGVADRAAGGVRGLIRAACALSLGDPDECVLMRHHFTIRAGEPKR